MKYRAMDNRAMNCRAIAVLKPENFPGAGAAGGLCVSAADGAHIVGGHAAFGLHRDAARLAAKSQLADTCAAVFDDDPLGELFAP